MLKKKSLWGLIPALFIGLAFLGGCNKPSPEKMAGHIVDELTTKLELNAAQQEQLNSAKTEILAKFVECKKSKEAMHDQLVAELGKDTLDQAHLKKMVESHKVEMDDIANLLIDRLAKFHGSLSAEQKKKLVQLIKDKEKCRKSCFFGH